MPGLKAAQARKEAFSTDLAGHIEACEKNYYRLVGMLPGLRDGAERWHGARLVLRHASGGRCACGAHAVHARRLPVRWRRVVGALCD